MTHVGEIAQVVDCEHRTAPRTLESHFGFSVGTSAVRRGRIVLEAAKPVSKETFESWTRRAIPQPGDLVFSREAPMGEVGAVPEGVPICLGQRTVLLRPDPRQVDKRFLLHALMAPASQQWIRDNAVGSGVLHLNVADVRRIPLPSLPPLDEQSRIVDLLEDHLSRLDAADAYLGAGLARATTWHTKLIDELIWSAEGPREEVRSLLREPMRNGRSDRAVKGSDVGTRTLTLTAVSQNDFVDRNTKLTTTPPDRAAGLWLEPGDVFVQRSNTPILVGTSARYEGPRDWAIFPDLLIRLRADESVVDSRFLVAALRSQHGHDQLRKRAKGAAGSMPKIDQDAIGSTRIPLPSLDAQRTVVERVAEADAGLERLRQELHSAQRRASALRRSVLAAAFSGRLTGIRSSLPAVEPLVNA